MNRGRPLDSDTESDENDAGPPGHSHVSGAVSSGGRFSGNVFYPIPLQRAMVYVRDEGSVFNAPLDTVWKYLQSDIDHGNSHKGRKNFERKPAGENAMILSWDQDVEGKSVHMSNRLTFHPPVGFFVEPLEGPMAGSKFFNFYVPKGNKTEVGVVGDWNSKTIPPAQLEKAVWANLEKVYSEDSLGIEEFSRKK
jgi:hypothetical protein